VGGISAAMKSQAQTNPPLQQKKQVKFDPWNKAETSDQGHQGRKIVDSFCL